MPIIKSEYIRRKLSYIKAMVEDDTRQKLYDINTLAEYIFMQILNDVYGWDLINANEEKPNFPAIDLIDTVNETVFQVTSETSTKKVREDTIEKFNELVKQDEYKQYAHYKIKMFYIKNKPNFSDKILEEFASKGVPKSHLYGIEDINSKVSANSDIANRVFKTLCKLLHDKACESDISPQLTTKLGKSSIIGRDKELQEIDERLKASNILLIKGIGGVGKSTIASNYLHRHKNEYAYYGFFEGLESFENEMEGAFKLEIEQGQDRLDRVLRELIKLEPTSNKLLVIDDIKEIKENQEKLDKILGLEHNGYSMLLTSREEIEDVEQYDLDVLSMEDAKSLFTSIYEVEDEVLLKGILKYLDYHTFFIEMTAKTLKSKKTLTPEIIKEKFENGKFSTIKRKRKESFNDYLNEIFSFDELDDEETLMLKQLSVLPSHEISFDNIQLILDKDNDEDFEDLLNYLTQISWVQQIKNHYKLHQIIKEYIFIKHPPSFKDIEKIVDFFYKLLSNSDSKVILFMQYNITFLDSLLKVFLNFTYEDKFNEKIIDFLNPLAHTYHKLSRLNDAKKTYELAVSISERIVEINSKSRVFTYGNISNFYILIEEYKLALNFLEKGFLEANRIYGTSDINKILSFYMTKANILMKYKGCKDAIPIYEKVINIRVKYYGEKHLSVGEAFNNLGVCFSKEKVYNKAKMCLVKSLQIYMDFYNNKHPDMVSITTNLAEVLMLQDKKEEALTWYNSALDMSLAYWGENHLGTALVYYNFSKYYFKYKEYKQAQKCLLKAIKTQRLFLDNNHSQLVNSLDGLRRIENKLNFHKIKIGRNNLCTCNSGKKYKKCCGKPK